MNILVTGATGFVGGAVLRRLLRTNTGICRGAVRRADATLPTGAETVAVTKLAHDADWTHALHDIDTVVHTAARVHVMTDTVTDPLAEFRRVNVAGTLRLARQAVDAGVKRLVFISSIKVNGEGTECGKPYTATDTPNPIDPYGISKYEAEEGLRHISRESGLEVVIVRPVLVYGPGVRANFFSMMRWVNRGLPLPFGAVHNQRSLVALDNLADLIVVCASHPSAAGETFLVSDGEDLSTTTLLRRMAKALGKPARFIPVPPTFLITTLRVLGKDAVARRLCGSLQVDIAPTRATLGWSPVVTVDEALRQTATHFLRTKT